MSKPKIYFCIPTYDRKVDIGTLFQTWQLGSDKYNLTGPQGNACSLLANGFNRFWVEALNARESFGITHFAMLHADILPLNRNWLEVMLDEMETHNADLVSGIVAIKDGRGVTSTGWHPCVWPDDHPDLEAFRANGTRPDYAKCFDNKLVRHVCIDHLKELPPTFDCGAALADDYLLVNTGLWLADIRNPLFDKCWFEIRDWLVRDESGKLIPKVMPEDWHFSMQVADLGGKVMATQKTPVIHYGSEGFMTLRTDPETLQKLTEQALQGKVEINGRQNVDMNPINKPLTAEAIRSLNDVELVQKMAESAA